MIDHGTFLFALDFFLHLFNILTSYPLQVDENARLVVMETLDGTEWDIVISGTGLPQSLLALYVSIRPSQPYLRLTDLSPP